MSASWPAFASMDASDGVNTAGDDSTADWMWQSLAPGAGLGAASTKLEELVTDGDSVGDWAIEKENATRGSNLLAPSSSVEVVPPVDDKAATNSTTIKAEATDAPPAPTKAATEEQRRQRHNANERRRTNALKTRILHMREELAALEKQRDRLQAMAAGGAAGAASNQGGCGGGAMPEAYLDTVRSIDQLRVEQQQLRFKLREFDMQNSTYQTILTEFGATPESRRLASTNASRQRKLGRASFDEYIDDDDDESESGGGASDDGTNEIYSEHAPIFQRVLLPHPMPFQDVMACVKQFYEEIMRFRAEREFDSLSSEIFGWRDRRILDAKSLRFMLSQHFEYVPAEELVYKTWNLLTTLSLYRRIQPRTVALKLLQRVTDDCAIVRLSVSSNGSKVHSSILLIARGRIDGGFLITYRSIPLTPAQNEFAKGEGNYVHLNNWYMFLDGVSERGVPACEVTLGGTVANQPVEYLRYLMMEVVAAVVRWQTAVGHSRFWLTN